MKHAVSPLERKNLQHCSFQELLDALASDAIMPGAGTAGGIALALAAACAGKAIAITLRHHAANTELVDLQQQFAQLRSSALLLAEADALQFQRHLKPGNPEAREELLRTDRRLVEDSQRLDALLSAHEHRIERNMMGDWQAARELSKACRLIENSNMAELISSKSN